jgi:uncharacterized protein (TIGR03437 family)
LTFQAEVEPAAGQQTVTLAATDGDERIEDTIQIMAALGPVLNSPGKLTATQGEALSFEVGAVDPAGLATTISANGLPAGASFDAASGRLDWVPNSTQLGRHEMVFMATNSSGQVSTAPVEVEVGSGAPVLDGEEEFSCSPNSVASLTGKWLALPGSANASGGTTVRVNRQAVRVLSSSATRVSFLCPVLDPGTEMSITVETPSGSTRPLRTKMREVSPAIFSLDGSGQSQGLVSFTESSDLAMVRSFRAPSHPAQPDDEILIWATGLGPAADGASGVVAIRLGGVLAEVQAVRAASGYPGVYTLQVRVPGTIVFGDAAPVELVLTTATGEQSKSNVVTIAVEPVGQ